MQPRESGSGGESPVDLSPREVAEALNLPTKTIRRLIRQGTLRARIQPDVKPRGRRYRVHPREVERLKRSGTGQRLIARLHA